LRAGAGFDNVVRTSRTAVSSGEMNFVEALVLVALPACLIVIVTITESRRLRRAAQRFRELEDERLDDSERLDALPEFGTARPTIRMPDGEIADADTVLRDALHELRAWPPNRGRDRHRA
jgi:hypothetical protein